MRTLIASAFAASCLLATPARADDTKPPQISDVKSSVAKGQVHIEARVTDETGVLTAVVHHRSPGGRVDESPMVKNDYDDVFKISFPGGADTEYWIESSDLLGNGPSTYGSSSKPYAAGGGRPGGQGSAVARNEPSRRKEEAAPREGAPPREKKERKPRAEPPPHEQAAKEEPPPARSVAKASAPPIIEHRKPGAQPAEGQDFTVRVKIRSESPVAVAILQVKQAGSANVTNSPLTRTEGDSYEGKIPGTMAKGNIEYFVAAKNAAGAMTRQGDGDAKTPYVITFKAAPGAAAPAASGEKPAGPYGFTHNTPYRVLPHRPIVVRAQIVPSSDDGQMPDRVVVLWRGNDAQDQITEMVRDENGGYGGYKAELPPQDEGAVFYQVVACDSGTTHCGVDTGSKRKWHAAAVAAQPGGPTPLPLEAVSLKAPAALPE
jgi:hypothetical protein